MDRFRGIIVHPQKWPQDLDYVGKRLIVIGSGATAATLIPAIAKDCARITMLQRSPTFFRTGRNAIEIADELRKLQVDEAWIHEIVRRKILFEQSVFTRRSFTEPQKVKEELLAGVRAYLGSGHPIERDFTPSYRPWRQRIAFVPDGDFLQAIAAGQASVVTDEIESFTETGIQLKSGKTLDADIIVTATGFHLNVLGDIDFTIDGEPLVFSDTVTYRGMMFTGVPNMAWVFGYFRASWTLRADLVADFVCRLLKHMKATLARRVEVQLRPEDRDMPLLSWIDEENFNPGYLMRGMHLLPKRGDKPEWQHTQDYWTEKDGFRRSTLLAPNSPIADWSGQRHCRGAAIHASAAECVIMSLFNTAFTTHRQTNQPSPQRNRAPRVVRSCSVPVSRATFGPTAGALDSRALFAETKRFGKG
jgi:cation diffusion facilitator CzcD-associated flavoprotein CzcO